MRKLIALGVAIAGLGCALSSMAATVTMGDMKITAKTIEWVGDKIDASDNVTYTNASKLPIPVGQTRVDTLTCKTLHVDLIRGKDKGTKAKDAIAKGGVVIDGRRSNVQKGQPAVIQKMHAVSDSATMDDGQDNVVLIGDVVVTITDPGQSEPTNTISGDRIVCLLKGNAIRVESQSERPAEAAMSVQEKEPSEARQK